MDFDDHSNYDALMNQSIDTAVKMRDVFKALSIKESHEASYVYKSNGSITEKRFDIRCFEYDDEVDLW